MSLKEMLLGGGGLLIVLLTMVEIAPIKFNPWSALAKGIGRAINAEMLNELKAVKSELADHIRKDDERNADEHGPASCGSTTSCCGTSPTRRRSSSMCWPTSTSTKGTVGTTRATGTIELSTPSPISAGSMMNGSRSMTS